MTDAVPGTALTPPETGPVAPSPAPTLSEAALAYARQALSPATRRAYGSHLRAWEAWCQAKA